MKPRRAAARWPEWAVYTLALFFVAWQLRSLAYSEVTDTDAARHAMNGAFIYDMVRSGHFVHPQAYGREYYGRFPAVSMPYHPPAFPAIEAVFYAIFGVSELSARLPVALAVGICALLLFRLARRTLGDDSIAACVTVTTLSLWNSQLVGSEVMLEFPALAFALAALLFLPEFGGRRPMRAALCFAGFAIAAMWTKQHASFLLGTPFLWAVLRRQWRLLLGKAIWVSSILMAIGVAGVTLFWAQFRGLATLDANAMGTTPNALRFIFFRNLQIYESWLTWNLPWLPAIFGSCGLLVLGWAAWKGFRGTKEGGENAAAPLYFAWILSVAAMLMIVGAANGRYLFWMAPAVIALVYSMLFRGGAYLWGERRALALAATFALLWFVSGLRFEPEFLRGPAKAAAAVVRPGVRARILYAGEADGNFTFAVRTLDRTLETTVISAEKLPKASFTPAVFEQFCRDYGVNWVVIEDVPSPHKWSGLTAASLASMPLKASIPLESNRQRWKIGQIRIYEFKEPSSHPLNLMKVPIRKMGRSVEVEF